MHHPVFSHFERFKGFVPPGYHTDFLGVMTRNAISAGRASARHRAVTATGAEASMDAPGGETSCRG
jgi:hypothetical protein